MIIEIFNFPLLPTENVKVSVQSSLTDVICRPTMTLNAKQTAIGKQANPAANFRRIRRRRRSPMPSNAGSACARPLRLRARLGFYMERLPDWSLLAAFN